MITIEIIMLSYLVIAALAFCIMKRLLAAMIIFASFGVVTSTLWILLAAPDLAIAEAAVGTGITGILLFVVLKRIMVMEEEYHAERDRNKNAE